MHVFLTCKFKLDTHGQLTSWSVVPPGQNVTHEKYNMHVFVTPNFKIDPINSNHEKVATSIFRRSRASNFIVRGGINITYNYELSWIPISNISNICE